MADIDFLVESVRERWRERQVFLLAQVKPLLVRHGIDVEGLLEGRNMKAWLEAEVPEIKLLRNEREPTNWGLAPAGEDTPEPYSQYFVTGRKRAPKSHFPYQNALRIAFTRPLPADHRRWIRTGPVRYLDLPRAERPDDGTELPAGSIETGADDARVVALVEHWIDQQGLSADAFLPERASAAVQPRRGRSALHQLLGLIGAEDLTRVSLPLDIVSKLLEKPEDGNR